jgi:hypothetical protein
VSLQISGLLSTGASTFAGSESAVKAASSCPAFRAGPPAKVNFGVTDSLSLAEAIGAAREAVKSVLKLTVPGLTGPAQATTVGRVAAEEATLADKPEAANGEEWAKKPTAKKSSPAGKTVAKKPGAVESDGVAGLVEAGVASD